MSVLLSEREAVCKKENFKLEILKVVKKIRGMMSQDGL